jgi:hypothetical protein
MAASHALRPITSVRIRNKAVASAFERPAYSLRVSCDHGVFISKIREYRILDTNNAKSGENSQEKREYSLRDPPPLL